MLIPSVRASTHFWDIGTSVGRLYSQSKGLVVCEPPFVAMRRESGDVLFLGREALALHYKATPNINVIPAMQGGVIASEYALTLLIRAWKESLDEEYFSLTRPQAVVTLPLFCDPTHQRALRRSFEAAGVGDVIFIPQSLCIGFFHSEETVQRGSVVLDIGAGKTEMACFLGKDILLWKHLPHGGEYIDDRIVRFFEEKYALTVSLDDAREMKTHCAMGKTKKKEILTIRGRSTKTNEDATLSCESDVLTAIFESFLQEIVELFRQGIEQQPDFFSSVARHNGVVLAGDMSKLRGIDTWFEEHLQMKVSCVARPAVAGILGAVKLRSDWSRYSYVQIHTRR